MYTGLNISSGDIKVLSVKGRQVKKWGSLALPNGLVRDGHVLEPKAVGEAIDELFKSVGISKDRVITSLAGLSFTYRFLELPRMKPSQMEEAVLRAARREISLPLEELYISWQSLPSRGEEQPVFVLGVPRGPVDAVEQTLKFGGIEPYLMDLRPLALARAARRKNAIIINLEPDCFDIVFIADGVPTVIHTISPRTEGATLEDNIHRLADELAKTTAYYQSNRPDSQLSPSTPLLLAGDMAADPAAGALLQTEIEYSIELLDPGVACPPDLPVTSFATCIGLALKKTPLKIKGGGDAYFHDININVFSGKHRKARVQPLPAGYMALGAFALIALVFLYPLLQSRTTLDADNAARAARLSALEHELNLANLAADEANLKEGELAEIESAIDTLLATDRSVFDVRGEYSRELEIVTAELPPSASFTSVEIENSQIIIRGTAESAFTVVGYATALETYHAFSEVRITELHEESAPVPQTDETGETTEVLIDTIIFFEIIVSK